MMGKEPILVSLGFLSLALLATLGYAYLFYVIHSIVRIADALERVAEELESDDKEDDEEGEAK